MLNLCGIVAAILKMVTARISSSHHFQNGCHNIAQIQHCPISTTFHMWVDYDVPTLKIFQNGRKNSTLSDIIKI
jgi:hypothetical protein